jgi:hypothetical protein
MQRCYDRDVEGPEQRTRRSDRPMVSLRRRPAGGDAERPAPAPGGEPADDRNATLARRIGIAAIVLTLGGGILLASLDSRSSPADTSRASPTPTAASGSGASSAAPSPVGSAPTVVPVLAEPSPGTVTDPSWTAHVSIPTDAGPVRGLTIRIYRNNHSVREQRVKTSEMDVSGITLKRGQNVVSAALVSSGGEGPRSSPVTVVLDDQGPAVDIVSPQDGDVVAGATVTVRGQTDPGTPVMLRNATQGSSTSVTADDTGAFRGDLGLGSGKNTLVATTVDALGNKKSALVTVTRSDTAANLQLTLSQSDFQIRDLPATVDLTVELRDLRGRPIDGAAVAFSLSPSGLLTTGDETTTVAGYATWSAAALPREGARPGDGFATARVTLSGGMVVQATKPITFH